MEFEWDEKKARSNELKHGIAFTEAQLAFEDDNAIELIDENPASEVRYQIIALSPVRLLFISFALRGTKIRIISARKATAREIQIYNEYNQ